MTFIESDSSLRKTVKWNVIGEIILCKKHVFRLQITMNNFVSFQTDHAVNDLFCKPSNELQRKTREVAQAKQVIQRNVQKFEYETDVVSKHKVVKQPNYMVFVRKGLFLQLFVDFDLRKSLTSICRFILYDFDRKLVFMGLANAPDNLTKGSFTEKFEDKVSIQRARTISRAKVLLFILG